MPESWRSGGTPPDTLEELPIHEPDETSRAAFWRKRLRSAADVEAQKQWQESGTMVERQARGLFDALASRTDRTTPIKQVPLGLPDTDALLAELARAAAEPDYQGSGEWQETIAGWRHVATPGGEIDALALLTDSEITAGARWEWWQKEIAGFLRYTLEKDWARLRDVEEPIPPVVPESQGPKEQEESPLEMPPPKQKHLKTGMDKMQESKEAEPNGYFSVHPFWGGYYREEVYERHTDGPYWEADNRTYQTAPDAGALNEERVFRGRVNGGSVIDLPLPYGFYPDPKTLQSAGKCILLVDEHGLYSLDARQATGHTTFTIVIGQPQRGSPFRPNPPKEVAVKKTHAGAEARELLSALAGTAMEKAGAIKRFIRTLLEYSNDENLNAVYEAFPAGYFAAIEEYKKADCDVSNGYNGNVLSVPGLKARLVSGHYVKNTDHKGAAIMNSGSRHAWTEVWDEIGKTWVRFDATPSKDPTLDEERPDEQAEDEMCEQPGDYGEEEAQKLSAEELEEWKEKLAKEAKRAEQKSPEQLQDEQFAKEAQCSVEEAARIRAKLEAARRMRDHKGRLIRQHLSDEFQKIVESNYKERPAWKGPVTRSEGEEMDDVVTIGKEVLSGSANPLGYTVEATETQLTQEYGGMDVYVVADRSGSMNEVDEASQKSKKEEQQLALFLLLDSLYGFSYKTEVASKQDQLISPLSVRSSVVAFQAGNADTIKQLGAEWKPKEQLSVWKGLESNVGGGTPAHLGLRRVREQIEKEVEQKNKRRRPGEPEPKKRLRVVTVFMDGGVDDQAQYLAEQKKLEELGVYVSSWGMTESANAVSAYPNGHCVKSVREMIEPVTEHIIEKAQTLKISKV